ncbi:MAG: hypothetical protein ACRCVU_05090 [Flavobacterium sp.]
MAQAKFELNIGLNTNKGGRVDHKQVIEALQNHSVDVIQGKEIDGVWNNEIEPTLWVECKMKQDANYYHEIVQKLGIDLNQDYIAMYLPHQNRGYVVAQLYSDLPKIGFSLDHFVRDKATALVETPNSINDIDLSEIE